jgi:glutathione S-transferase
LAGRIALHEAGLTAEFESVDLKNKTLRPEPISEASMQRATCRPCFWIAASIVTENIAVLSWISDQSPKLAIPVRWDELG